MKTFLTILSLLLAASLEAEPVCVGDVCYPSREAAVAAGALPQDDDGAGYGVAALKAVDDHAEPPQAIPLCSPRTAFGYMRPREFLSFLRGEQPNSPLAGNSILAVILLVLLGGLAANLTPCVLPLVPVNVAILLGRAESSRASRMARGLAYGAGMAAAYGALGLAAAFGGMAFGALQSSPWFNAAVAAVFIVLGFGMLGVVNIDAAAAWRRMTSGSTAKAAAPRPATRGLGGAFLLGAGAAVLAGACVQPILLATLVYTADGFAAGHWWAISLPFLLGAGMGLPWVFVAAGISVLPRPGAWMVWVKRVFAIVIFAMAAWYANLAWQGFRPAPKTVESSAGQAAIDATPDTWTSAIEAASAAGKPILVDVWATWCKNCLAMESSTLKDPEVSAEMRKFTVIRLQAEDMAKLANIAELSSLGIKGLPAFVVFGECNGENKESAPADGEGM